MLFRKFTSLVAVGLVLANCASAPGEQSVYPRNTALCVVIGAAVVAGVVLIAGAVDQEADKLEGLGKALPSDLRLKRDVRPVGVRPNGFQLYSFRYWNDDTTFVGVMAQDLLEDERLFDAVIEDASGFSFVDLAALRLGIAGDAERYFEAGRAAVLEADSIVN